MRVLLDLQLARDLNRDSGLSEADYDVLSTLSEQPHGQWRAHELSSHLNWSTSRLAHHVGRMERRGLVARKPCENDARGAVVTLTERGWNTLRDAAHHHVASVRRNMIDLLTPEEIAALDSIAAKVVSQLYGESAGEQAATSPPKTAR